MALFPCKECGQQISTTAQACPHCGAPRSAPKKQVGTKDYVLGGAVLGAIFLAAMAGSGGGSNSKSASGPASSVATGEAVQPRAQVIPATLPVSPSLVLPAAEQGFVDILEASRRAYNAGANDMAKGASRPTRARSLCSSMSGTSVERWVGTIINLSTNSDGNGVLGVSIGKDISLKTWNNAFSDISDNTLLNPNGSVFRSASNLSVGQKVRFSGNLVREKTDCFRESSMSMNGSMTDPEFIFRFTSIEPI